MHTLFIIIHSHKIGTILSHHRVSSKYFWNVFILSQMHSWPTRTQAKRKWEITALSYHTDKLSATINGWNVVNNALFIWLFLSFINSYWIGCKWASYMETAVKKEAFFYSKLSFLRGWLVSGGIVHQATSSWLELYQS